MATKKAFLYSRVFVLGLSLTFTVFGATAGLLGTMFGTLGGPWYLIAGIIALVMGGQLMGFYEIRLPIKRDFKPKQGGIVGAFPLGLFFGVVSSSCATPVLVVLLTLVASKGQVLYGSVDWWWLQLVAGLCGKHSNKSIYIQPVETNDENNRIPVCINPDELRSSGSSRGVGF